MALFSRHIHWHWSNWFSEQVINDTIIWIKASQFNLWHWCDLNLLLHDEVTEMMLEKCWLTISQYGHCLKQQEALRPDETFNQRQQNVRYVFILICVRAAEIGLVICRKPHHIECLCTGDERERSHLTAIRDQSAFLCFFSAVYSFNHESVTFPSVLQGSSVVNVFYTVLCLCQYSHSPSKIQVMQSRSHTVWGLFWALEAVKVP